jgi:branched-chain amino acid transport system permease protein
MGVNVAGYKLLAFVLGAVIAGVAGGLNAITPSR